LLLCVDDTFTGQSLRPIARYVMIIRCTNVKYSWCLLWQQLTTGHVLVLSSATLSATNEILIHETAQKQNTLTDLFQNWVVQRSKSPRQQG